MSRTILTDVKGFTPIMDNVLKDTNLMAAVVFGSIWRYCQMENGVCQATLDKIADRVGISKQSTVEYIKILEKSGYIFDDTPDLRNRPHTYKDTGKAGLHMGVSALNVAECENSALNVVDSALNVAECGVKPRLIEDSIKKELKKDNTKITKESISSKAGLDWLIAGGASQEEVTAVVDNEKRAKVATDTYEQYMGFNPLPWSGKLERLKKFLMTKTEREIRTFATWCKRDFSSFTPSKARLNPDMVIDLWPQAFDGQDQPSTHRIVISAPPVRHIESSEIDLDKPFFQQVSKETV